MLLHLQKICKGTTESSLTPIPIPPIMNILHSYSTFVTINEPMWVHYYLLKSIFYSLFLSFYLMSLFCCRVLPRYHITFSYHVFLGSSWLRQFLRVSEFLMTLKILRYTGQVFCKMPLNYDCSRLK